MINDHQPFHELDVGDLIQLNILNPTALYLLRHGKPDYNSVKRLMYGYHIALVVDILRFGFGYENGREKPTIIDIPRFGSDHNPVEKYEVHVILKEETIIIDSRLHDFEFEILQKSHARS